MSDDKNVQSEKKSWFKEVLCKRRDELIIGIIAGVISSAVFTLILRIPELKTIVFDLPREPKCESKRIPSDNLFKYEWAIELDVQDKSRVLVYNNTDFNILSGTFQKNDYIYHFGKINEYKSGDYLGFIAYFEKPKKNLIVLKFITESTNPLEANSCQNFLISL